MSVYVRNPLALVSACLWVGFVASISFMEAWLKFQAPGITLALGLGIGRIVFAALNRMEWIFLLVIALHYGRDGYRKIEYTDLTFFIPVVVLLLQTFVWLPTLDLRAELHIQGAHMPPSTLHLVYILAEVVKVVCLMTYIATRFKRIDYASVML